MGGKVLPPPSSGHSGVEEGYPLASRRLLHALPSATPSLSAPSSWKPSLTHHLHSVPAQQEGLSPSTESHGTSCSPLSDTGP